MNETWWRKPNELDDDQKDVITLPIDKNCLVEGPPGSGKTNIILLRASYLFRMGMTNTLVLTFGGVLKEFLISGSSFYEFESNRLTTSWQWMTSFCKLYGKKIQFSREQSFREKYNNLVELVKSIVSEKNLQDLYRVILLDEAQDFLPEEIEIFNRLSKRLFFVADTQQKIYEGPDNIGLLKTISTEQVKLRYHYRNGKEICRFADAINSNRQDYSPMEPTSKYDESKFKSYVDLTPCENRIDQFNNIISKVRSQRDAYPNHFIGILSPSYPILKEMYGAFPSDLKKNVLFQDREEGYLSFDPRKPIILTTLHSAKGLEFRAVHILESQLIPTYFQECTYKLIYTAATRAKTTLDIYCTGAFPPFIQQAHNDIKDPEPNQDTKIDSLFR